MKTTTISAMLIFAFCFSANIHAQNQGGIYQKDPASHNHFMGKSGFGINIPDYTIHVEEQRTSSTGGIIYAKNTNVGSGDAKAIYGVSVPQDGWGYGVQGVGGYRGVYGQGQGGAYTGTTIGVYATATGTAGTRTGLYATASGGTSNNWAGYFASGDVYVKDTLKVGNTGGPTGYRVSVDGKIFANGDVDVNDTLRVGNTGGATGYLVSVDGKLIAEDVVIKDSDFWPDYVFKDDYQLKTLAEVEMSIRKNGHLPGVPSAKEIEADGIKVGEMQKLSMEKIEELTLYLIAQDKRMKALEIKNESLIEEIKSLKK